MLAVSGKPFNSAEWVFEPKIDGTRCLADVTSSGVRLHNRRLFEITYRYPEITAALGQGASGCVLDGEVAVFVDGKPSFAALAERDHQSEKMRIDYLARAVPTSYVVFDILYAKEKSIMDLPLRERKQILREELQESESVSIADSFPEKGEESRQELATRATFLPEACNKDAAYRDCLLSDNTGSPGRGRAAYRSCPRSTPFAPVRHQN